MRTKPLEEASRPTCTSSREQRLVISSINIEGVKSNVTGLQDVMKTSHIVCVQEHWLWGYEKDDLASLAGDDWNYHIVCADVAFPIPKSERRRGHGGVAILWKRDLQDSFRRLDEGNERIIAVECKSQNSNICLLCAYMPTSGYSDTVESYGNCVDLLKVIISKYRETHLIILCGDISNATVLASRNTRSL